MENPHTPRPQISKLQHYVLKLNDINFLNLQKRNFESASFSQL